jgi:hypothetical protein
MSVLSPSEGETLTILHTIRYPCLRRQLLLLRAYVLYTAWLKDQDRKDSGCG